MAEVEGVANLTNETKQGLRKGGFRATMFIFCKQSTIFRDFN